MLVEATLNGYRIEGKTWVITGLNDYESIDECLVDAYSNALNVSELQEDERLFMQQAIINHGKTS